MATSAGEDFGQALASLIQIVFSPLFPVILITLCAVSYALTFVFHLPQFALFAFFATSAIEYASGHLWAALALAAFVLAAVPLARVGFREAATQTSRVVGNWVVAALFGGGLIWLAQAWPFSGYNFQQLAFALLLFCAWVQVCETVMMTVKLVALSRPQPGREVVESQKAHGDAALAGEAEAVSLLNPKK